MKEVDLKSLKINKKKVKKQGVKLKKSKVKVAANVKARGSLIYELNEMKPDDNENETKSFQKPSHGGGHRASWDEQKKKLDKLS